MRAKPTIPNKTIRNRGHLHAHHLQSLAVDENKFKERKILYMKAKPANPNKTIRNRSYHLQSLAVGENKFKATNKFCKKSTI